MVGLKMPMIHLSKNKRLIPKNKNYRIFLRLFEYYFFKYHHNKTFDNHIKKYDEYFLPRYQ